MSFAQGYSEEDKINAVLRWSEEAEEAEDFDASFVESLQTGLEKYGRLTERQEDALDNIIERWRIDVGDYS